MDQIRLSGQPPRQAKESKNDTKTRFYNAKAIHLEPRAKKLKTQ